MTCPNNQKNFRSLDDGQDSGEGHDLRVFVSSTRGCNCTLDFVLLFLFFVAGMGVGVDIVIGGMVDGVLELYGMGVRRAGVCCGRVEGV